MTFVQASLSASRMSSRHSSSIPNNDNVLVTALRISATVSVSCGRQIATSSLTWGCGT